MFRFYWPWFALLLPLPLLARLFTRPKSESVPEIRFPALERLKTAFPTGILSQAGHDRFFLSTLFLAWVCFVAALMQPEKANQFRQISNKGYDLMLAVDISASMQAMDFSTPSKPVSRLDAVKEVVSDFVKRRQGDRVGLITFGEHAYLHVPLTLDTLSVSKTLSKTFTGMAGNATAIGDAIGLGVKTLRDRPEGSRVLVLLTDGEDNASSLPPLEAAKLAKKYGIRLYTIGVGRNGPVPVPTRSGGYAMAQVPIDEKLLKEVAEMTGGSYFKAFDKKSLESIYRTINEMEKSESNVTEFVVREPYYPYPLGVGMALLLLLTFYQVWRRKSAYGV